MKIALGKIVTLFEDGISLSSYQCIGRLINQYGPLTKIELESIDNDSLREALKQAEQNKKVFIIATGIWS